MSVPVKHGLFGCWVHVTASIAIHFQCVWMGEGERLVLLPSAKLPMGE